VEERKSPCCTDLRAVPESTKPTQSPRDHRLQLFATCVGVSSTCACKPMFSRASVRNSECNLTRDVALSGFIARSFSGVFLKEPVKPKRFPFGFFRTGSAWRSRLFSWFVGRGHRDEFWVITVVTFRDSSRLSSLREVAIVLFRVRLLPTHSFARYRSRLFVNSSAV
jgi:hypothetical protein